MNQPHTFPRPFLKRLQLPTLVLAAAIQCAPLSRTLCVLPQAAPGNAAVIFKWALGVAALFGSYHAVSAASATIQGLSNLNATGPAITTTNAIGRVGQDFKYRIVVTDAGKDHTQDFWDAKPLPPGLTINTNVGSYGWITGLPTQAGKYPVTLVAGNENFDTVITKDVFITIQEAANAPPTIEGSPQDQIASVGTTVTFTVTATGSNLSYRWQFNGIDLPNANTPTLTLPQVATSNSGTYTVVVSNGAGAAANRSAQLLVLPEPGPELAPTVKAASLNSGRLLLSFTTAKGYRYILQASGSLRPESWVQVTNVAPSLTAGEISLLQNTRDSTRFYRLQVTGN